MELVDYHCMRPMHPGLAKALNVAAPRVNDIIRERRGISADTAMRLARSHGCMNAAAAYLARLAKSIWL